MNWSFLTTDSKHAQIEDLTIREECGRTDVVPPARHLQAVTKLYLQSTTPVVRWLLRAIDVAKLRALTLNGMHRHGAAVVALLARATGLERLQITVYTPNADEWATIIDCWREVHGGHPPLLLCTAMALGTG